MASFQSVGRGANKGRISPRWSELHELYYVYNKYMCIILKKKKNHESSCIFIHVISRTSAEEPTSQVGRVVDNYPYFYRIFIFYACVVYIGVYRGRAQARLASYEILLYFLILIILIIF